MGTEGAWGKVEAEVGMAEGDEVEGQGEALADALLHGRTPRPVRTNHRTHDY